MDQSKTSVELEVLEGLKPSPNVEMLTIKGFRWNSLPGWISSTQNGFSNLNSIKLCGCYRLTTLPAFGELPSLEVLILECLGSIETLGDEFYGSSNVVFPSLKELTFIGMSRWREWSDVSAGRKSFPHLKQLHLVGCLDMNEIPSNIFTSSIVELNVSTNVLFGYINKFSINCTGLNLLEVICLIDIRFPSFVGGLKSLVNLRKLEIKGFNEILELVEVEQVNDGTCQENQFLTYLHLEHHSDSKQNLPIAGRFRNLRSLFISYSSVTEYIEEEFNHLTSLETLEFSHCRLLRCLPSALPLLSKLKKLTIKDCPMISSLPEFGLPQ